LKKLFNTKVKIVLVLAVVLAVLTAVVATLHAGATPGESAVQTLLSPLRSGFSSLTRLAERYYNYIFNYETLEAENKALNEKIASMEEEVRSADSLQRENERLRQLLELSEDQENYSFSSAYIVSWDTSNYKSTFTIGKGTHAGLSEGMVAVTEYGQVVGRITAVGSNWATVTTVLDSSLQISGAIASSGCTGIVQGAYATGQKGSLRMDYLPTEAVIRNNDQVVTTGSTVYPKGLIIGYIQDADFDETGVAKYAILTPAADFDNLEQIFIITDYTVN
jgi:rod shape-determining protein MreC